ncbi:hypothetical protein TNCT_628041 [Trichonephila clavata]|uniref:Uncharacterized protein n=1 Tax=Trichonephila clavata TaxID=2740835 RepID=A0A8X6KJ05_TRICU|nr:hypothetical protein TNCT_628041 [Trichonephila clavata]
MYSVKCVHFSNRRKCSYDTSRNRTIVKHLTHCTKDPSSGKLFSWTFSLTSTEAKALCSFRDREATVCYTSQVVSIYSQPQSKLLTMGQDSDFFRDVISFRCLKLFWSQKTNEVYHSKK